MDPPLQVLPIGGLGEIGMNCMLIGRRGRWVMVDCGVQFPDAGEIGVERRLPDFRFLETWRDRVEAVIITHGHEDHIGALPWVLPVLSLGVPVFASRFTRELIQLRLSEHGRWSEDLVTEHRPRERFTAGPFEVEPLRVTHSLPDCSALVLRSADGTIVHTGDWKHDLDPVDGDELDREGLESLGREGVTLLLSDSTNVLTPGRTVGERAVGQALGDHIAGWEGRVFVAQFSSNLHRLAGLAAAAEATGRRLVLSGNSLHKYLAAAARAGRAPVDPSVVIDVSRIHQVPADEALVVTTGTQGETLAALTRAARGQHRHLHLGKGDLILHSARVIPGNEGPVYDMFNRLARRGCEIVYGRRSGIHASGHAREDELRDMIRWLRPAHFVPIHGEYTFLQRHAAVALDEGVPGATVVDNGEVFGFGAGSHAGELSTSARIAVPGIQVLYNDGPATGDREEMLLGERIKVAWNGVVVVDVEVEVDQDGARPRAGEVRVDTRALWLDGGALPGALEAMVRQTFETVPVRTPLKEIEAAVVASLRALCRRRAGKRPEVMVIMHQGRAK